MRKWRTVEVYKKKGSSQNVKANDRSHEHCATWIFVFLLFCVL